MKRGALKRFLSITHLHEQLFLTLRQIRWQSNIICQNDIGSTLSFVGKSYLRARLCARLYLQAQLLAIETDDNLSAK